ncbi:2834_t:CDS:1, partial [Scutellospora calospora]
RNIDKNKIYLKKNSHPSWHELEKKFKLGYGRKYDEDKDKAADMKAYNIENCEFKVFERDNIYDAIKTISSNDELVRNKRLFLKAHAEQHQ